jgi:hypothetical protein
MLQVEYRLKLGQDEFVLKAEVKDEKEFFETMAFYSSLPRTAPGGSSDLKIGFRTTKEGHKYYSLVSEKEKMEFKLGQNKEAQGGGLFPKGWEPLYQGEKEQSAPQQQYQSQAPLIGQFPGLVNPTTGPTAAAPIQAPVAAPAFAAPIPQPMAAPIQPTPAAVPAPMPVQAANPQVTAVANNVLARFGINK